MSRIFQKWKSAIFILEYGTGTQVVHGCRQLVRWRVWLSPATSATLVLSCLLGSLRRLRAQALRKVRMTSSQHAPYTLGDTRNTMAGTIRSYPARARKSAKLSLSSDCRLQLAYMKPESLVIASQPYGGEYVLRFCTHRPSHQESIQRSKSLV